MSRAALLTRLGAPLTIGDIRPFELRHGQVRVRVLCSGICGAQLQEIDGHKKGGPMPHPLGHEGCGIVQETGPGVTRVSRGQKVVMHWRKADGIESEYPEYDFEGERISGGLVTTFCEESVVSENRLTPVPMDVPEELCALLGCSLSTALGVIEREAGGIKFGQSVLIVGCGGLGVSLIIAAIAAQAGRIAVLDINPGKEALALDLGASQFFSVPPDKDSFDFIIETSGRPAAIEAALTLLAPSGRFVMVGQPRPGEAVSILAANHLFHGSGKTIVATQGGGFDPSRDIPRYVAMYRKGLLSVSGVISHHAELGGINEAIAMVRAGDAGRILVQM